MHTLFPMMGPAALPIERLDAPFPIFRADCRGVLPGDWRPQITDCVSTFVEFGFLSGLSSTSRQAQLGSFADHIVGTTTGKVVQDQLPWLMEFYRGHVLQLGNRLGLDEFVVSDDERSCVNINVLPTGSGYEWHVDTNPLTGLLFVTDHPAGAGGELVFRPDPLVRANEDWELTVFPEAGFLLLFDAREAAHAVRPVAGVTDRISVPMNFYYANAQGDRPDHLDRYLYGE
jgi:hypothetical protein